MTSKMIWLGQHLHELSAIELHQAEAGVRDARRMALAAYDEDLNEIGLERLRRVSLAAHHANR